MKNILIAILTGLLIISFARKKDVMDDGCEKIKAASRNGALVFTEGDKMYLLDLEKYHLKDIYTGNIYLIDMSKKKKEVPRKKWDLFLLNKSFKCVRIK